MSVIKVIKAMNPTVARAMEISPRKHDMDRKSSISANFPVPSFCRLLDIPKKPQQ